MAFGIVIANVILIIDFLHCDHFDFQLMCSAVKNDFLWSFLKTEMAYRVESGSVRLMQDLMDLCRDCVQ